MSKLKRVARGTTIVLLCALALVGAILLGTSLWVQHEFGITSVDQALINLEGAGQPGGGGAAVVVRGVFWGLVVPVVCVATVAGSALLWRRRSENSRISSVGIPLIALGCCVVIPVLGVAKSTTVFSLDDYVKSTRSTQSVGDYYVVPANPEVGYSADGVPLNLVLIYLESTEDAFRDTSIFEQNVFAPLDAVTEGWYSIPALQEYYGGGFTMSGIVSTQCGIPLRTGDVGARDGDAMNELGGNVASYLPGATCLGDVLQANGYEGVFMGGANGAFSGKSQFFLSHGYGESLGREEWEALGETEGRSDWGLSDRRLVELAKEKVTELHEGSQPFVLSLLTLDTHPAEYVLPYCEITTDVPYTSIYRCSMEQVASFVSYMEDQGYLEDTVVMIMGDHLRLAGSGDPLHGYLTDLEGRTIYNRIWSPQAVDIQITTIDQISVYPTILELLGVDLEGGRAGVGVSALTEEVDRGSIRALTPDDYQDLLRSRSASFYDEMWQTESEYTRTNGEADLNATSLDEVR